MNEAAEKKIREVNLELEKEREERLAAEQKGRMNLLSSVCSILYFRFNVPEESSSSRFAHCSIDELNYLYEKVRQCGSLDEFNEAAEALSR